MSSFKPISFGVPRGSILGRLMFIICMNDSPSCVKKAEITMYTDGTSLYKGFRTTQDLSDKNEYASFECPQDLIYDNWYITKIKYT